MTEARALEPAVDVPVRADDGQTWSRALEAAYDPVYRGIVAMGATPEDAADAMQDAVERALRQRTPPRRADGWLFVVAMNEWRRRRWRERLFSPFAALRERVEDRERDGEIDLLVELRRLTERQRTVIVARYVLGLTQRETAELLGVSPGTVAATASQANQRLRERLRGTS